MENFILGQAWAWAWAWVGVDSSFLPYAPHMPSHLHPTPEEECTPLLCGRARYKQTRGYQQTETQPDAHLC